ncbi:Uma2 family endonuclease (plasmid) [Kovacikia minuta CCNUW1]|uniref:Uma2 family endonuclease n=1 Tax=Kovacikia minuta TaxID=2931930 RepID=UPI001CCA7B82|nr:Uma2 family endonuclease [Kovacikia minuta]UBF30321.1 Uma2 family endonuclease [Kovacikia minuta CCNUW1]
MTSRPSVPQTDPPLPPRLTLPTMYDLPSEDPEEPGLPDEFHDLQPQLLSRTLRLTDYAADQIFTGSDLNLYYDVWHPLWHKRPDWFLVLNVPRLYEGTELRSSYVVWQEGVNPFVVVELLSPGTEKEDLGEQVELATNPDQPVSVEAETVQPENGTAIAPESANGQSGKETPPRKWKVYERVLRVPYYVVFSRYTNKLRFFQLVGGHYQEQPLDPSDPRIWIPELKLGLGLWQGTFEGISRFWLRWYDSQGTWMLTDAEQERQEKELALTRAEQEQQRAEQEQELRQQAEAQLKQVSLNLLQSGMTVDQVVQLTGLSEDQIRQWIQD